MTKDHESQVHFHQLSHGLQQNIKSFVGCHVGDNADQRHSRIDGQPELPTKVTLVYVLPFQAGCGIIAFNVGVSLWIPDLIIHTVPDAGKNTLPLFEQSMQTESILLGKNFPFIGRADSVDRIGKKDTPL